MGYLKLARAILLSLCIYVLLSSRQAAVRASPTNGNRESTQMSRNRALRFSPRTYSRVRQEPIVDFVDDDDLFDVNKRQSDDYGHMRFGKREFEDYGHMRFGRSGSD